ncbi:hypothetical protein [Vogesella sp. LIG4]|uniref:hypothetical protein n=1 Tax=Vogesella sp. LIG4 TaxID=1192162 RepID=UPI0012FD488E|nr:hypothetical protein [Vogesella sp. LIG4]
MKKPLIFIVLAAVSATANSTNSISIEKYLPIKTIAPEKIDATITTPSFIQYIQPGKRTPSCSIILQDKKYKVIFFEQDDTDDYSNCNKIYPPTITKIKGQFYAAYKYSEEETRGSLVDNYVVMSLTKNNFHICQNQEKIITSMKKTKKQTATSLSYIIEHSGCL